MAPSARSEPRHHVALRAQQLGEAAHADAADADEVDALDAAEATSHARSSASARQRAAIVSAASGRAERRGARAHRAQARRIVEQRHQLAREGLVREARVRVEHARRARALELARVRELLAAAHVRERHQQGGAPGQRELGDRDRARAAHDQIRPAVARGHVALERRHHRVEAGRPIARLDARAVALAGLVHHGEARRVERAAAPRAARR